MLWCVVVVRKQEKASSKRVLIVLVGLLLVALVSIGWYTVFFSKGTSCRGVIDVCCVTNHFVKVSITGDCDAYTLVVVNPATGDRLVEAEVRNGDNLVNGSFLTYGDYIVELYYKGELLDSVRVPLSLQPYIEVSKAVLFPNGTLLVDVNYNVVNSTCFSDYGIKSVTLYVMYKNNTNSTIEFTGPWHSDSLTIDTGLNPLDIYSLYVYVTDTLNTTIQVPAAIPR